MGATQRGGLRISAAAPLACALLAWGAACGSESAPHASSIASTAATIEAGAFHAREADVAHRGERRIDLYDPQATPPGHLAYRERVVTDGEGRYSLVPVEALTPVQPGWELIQRNREGYLFRYRDFEVRDRGLFLENYVWIDLDERVRVAGRECARYRAERVVGPRKTYDLALDLETDLILRAEERDAEGRLLSVMAYESFGLDPDLGSAVWFTGVHEERELDRTESLESQLSQVSTGLEPLTPRLLPAGFELREAFTLVDRDDTRWLKLTYTDGVESLFFLTTLSGDTGESTPVAANAGPEGAGDEVLLFRMGAARAAQGTIGGRRIIAVGKVSDDALLDLIESSLP